MKLYKCIGPVNGPANSRRVKEGDICAPFASTNSSIFYNITQCRIMNYYKPISRSVRFEEVGETI